jgi:hypothetical protein
MAGSGCRYVRAQVHAMSLEWCGAPPGERVVLWLVLWAKMRLI